MPKATFNAKVKWSQQGVYCEAESRGFKVAMDEPPMLGGTDKAMNPVELLLSALGGCMTICAAAFAPACKVDLKDFWIDLEGDLDPDGFMGKNPDVRTGFQEVRFKMNFVTDSPAENVAKLKALIEERCPVSDTLSGVHVKAIVE